MKTAKGDQPRKKIAAQKVELAGDAELTGGKEERKGVLPSETPKSKQPLLLNQKRTKMTVDNESNEKDVMKESQIEQTGERKIIKARRRFNDSELVGEAGKEESTRDDADTGARGKFVLKSSLSSNPTSD